MKVQYKNPIADHVADKWLIFEEQARLLTTYLARFGFHIDALECMRVRSAKSWKFSAILKNSNRIIHLSMITTAIQAGAVSLFIYPMEKKKGHHYISLYKYLREHFSMVNRKYLFLSQYRGDFAQRLHKVIHSYARFSQFYMQSILQGIKWDDDDV